MNRSKTSDILFWVALLWVFSPLAAFAYLDPGTGSYVVQVVVGSLLGLGFVLKTYWGALKVKVNHLFSKQNQE